MDYDIPPATVIESTEQRPHRNYAIPHDEAPFEAVIQPGETVHLYGRIQVTNEEEEAVLARTYFRLRQGFVLTVHDENMQLVVNEKVSMHQHYTLKKVEGTWVLEVMA